MLEDALHAINGAKLHNLDVLGIVDYSNMHALDALEELSDYVIDLKDYK